MLKTYEITGHGFDGGSDATDDRVFWVKAANRDDVVQAIAGTKAAIHGVIDPQADIDFHLPADAGRLKAKLFEFESDSPCRDPNLVYENGSDDTFWSTKVLCQGERFNVEVYDADGDRRPDRECLFEDEALAIAFADRSILRASQRVEADLPDGWRIDAWLEHALPPGVTSRWSVYDRRGEEKGRGATPEAAATNARASYDLSLTPAPSQSEHQEAMSRIDWAFDGVNALLDASGALESDVLQKAVYQLRLEICRAIGDAERIAAAETSLEELPSYAVPRM